MPREFSRTQRVSEQLKRELATLIQQEVKDPRVGMITVAAVEVSKDLAHARIYITALNEGHDSDDAAAVLNHAAGFLRGRLGKRVVMRSIPQLHFVYDHAQQYGAELSALIDAAVDEDRERRNEPVAELHGQDPE
jgi:ribosome-binding factor A